jgi:ABC-2 type transport system ATP-binding protein
MNSASGPMSDTPLLTIDGVSYQYHRGSVPSLRAVTLQIPRGRIFGLLGPNGAGKTTLISLLAGLLPMQQGRLLFEGRPLDEGRRVQPSAVALVPQDNAVYPMLTVLENLQFFAGVQNIGGALRRQRIDEALRFCQLEHVTRRPAAQLSGGLRRRLNLAIGLVGDPTLLLLDEPTVGVDPQSRHFLLDSIAALRDQGKTVVYTSHYMDEVEALCDAVAIMDHGRVLMQGSLADIAASDRERLEFSLRSPLTETLHTALTARLALQQTGSARYEGLLPASDLAGFIADLRTHGCELLSLAHGRQNLEQIFMRLTRRSLRD